MTYNYFSYILGEFKKYLHVRGISPNVYYDNFFIFNIFGNDHRGNFHYSSFILSKFMYIYHKPIEVIHVNK